MDFNCITTTINEYTLKTFGITVDCGLDFSYYPDACYDEPDITYSLIITERFDRLYSKFIEKNFGLTAPIFLLSLFHEIGHHFTNDYWSNKEQRSFAKQKALLNGNDDNDTLLYYSLPDEYEATKWGIEYIESHPEEVEKFWNILRTKIEQFYKENEINEV